MNMFKERVLATEFITMLLVGSGFMLALIDSGNWGGWFFFSLSFCVLLFERSIRDNISLYVACCLVLILFHLLSFIYAHSSLISTWFADADHFAFDKHARQVALSSKFVVGLGAEFYHNFLGFLYSLNFSQFFGQEANVFAFAVFLVYLCKFMKLLNIRDYRVLVILTFVCLPNYLLWFPMLLRESWELLLFGMVIYHGLNFRLQKRTVTNFILIIVFLFLWCLWHRGLYLYAPFLLLMVLFWPFFGVKGPTCVFEKFVYGLVLLGVVIVVYLIAVYPITGLQAVSFGTGSFFAARETIPVGGSNYVIGVSGHSILSLIKYIFLLFYHYLFTPLPWQVKSLATFMAMLYVFLRIFLLFAIAWYYKLQSGVARRVTLFLLAIYFSFSLFWALGVSNYGTALRHQTLADWILILLGLPVAFSFLCRLCGKMFGSMAVGKGGEANG